MKRFGMILMLALTAPALLDSAWGDDFAAGSVRRDAQIDGQVQTRLETLPATAPQPPGAGFFAPRSTDETDDLTGELLWQTGDPYGMCNDCAVSPDGAWFGLGISLNNQRAESYQWDLPTPLWQYSAGEGATHVALSSDGEIFAFAHEHYLTVFHAWSRTPLWTFDFGADAWAYYVAVARDGSRIIAQAMVDVQGLVYSFSPASSTPQWVQSFQQPVGFGWYGLRLSADGSRVSANGKYTVWVLDARDGGTIWSADANNTESPVPLSGDGGVLAIGSNNAGTCKVYTWDELQQTYNELWTYAFTGGTSRWCSEVEISADGNTVAAGSLEFLTLSTYDGHAAVFDTWGGGTPLWISDSFGDMVGEIALSDDGQIVAVGSWGNQNNATPDLRIYQRAVSTPFFTVNSPGSINSVDMSTDGGNIFAGGKHVHNRIFGNGGDAYAILVSSTPADVTIELEPVDPPIIIPPDNPFSFWVTVTNNEATAQSCDLWTMVQLPDLTWYGPVLGPARLTLPAEGSLSRERSQMVPDNTPLGTYWYEGRVGDYPAAWESSGFEVLKTGFGNQDPGFGEWANAGEMWEMGENDCILQPLSFSFSVSPNPFNPSAAISYKLQTTSYVSMKIYDLAGREVAVLVNGRRDAGSHETTFDGTELPSGMYFARLTVASGTTPTTSVQKLVLLK